MLHAEEQLLEDVASADDGVLAGTLTLGASTGPGAHLVPLLLCEFQRRHADLAIALSISARTRSSTASPTASSSSGSSARCAATGRCSSSRWRRTRSCSPSLEPPAAGGEISVADLRDETLVVMRGRRRASGGGRGAAPGGAPRSRARVEARARAPGIGEERGGRRVRRRLHLAHGDRRRAGRGDPRGGPRQRDRAHPSDLRRACEGRKPSRAAAAFLDFAAEQAA